MPYFTTCPHCGAHLDPGERCGCRSEEKTAQPLRRTATAPGTSDGIDTTEHRTECTALCY